MKRLLFPVFLVLAGAVASAADPIPKSGDSPVPTVPLVTLEAGSPVTAEVGKKCVVEVKTTAKKVTWKVPAGVDSVPLDAKRLAVWALPGTYTITALAPNGDDVVLADLTLTITGDIGPSSPVSTLNNDVKLAYAADKSMNKADLVKKLAALYRAAGTVTVKDTSIKTYYDLFSDVSTANAAQMGQTDLQGVRVVIQKYLDGKLPTDKTTPINRTTAGTEFLNVATALEAIK